MLNEPINAALSELSQIQKPADYAKELDALLAYAVGSPDFKKLKGSQRTNLTMKTQALAQFLRSL